MATEESKDTAENTSSSNFGFNPKELKGMFEKISKCYPNLKGMSRCNDMMRRMMVNCCEGAKNKDNKAPNKEQKHPVS
jgi:hypothetical protein